MSRLSLSFALLLAAAPSSAAKGKASVPQIPRGRGPAALPAAPAAAVSLPQLHKAEAAAQGPALSPAASASAAAGAVSAAVAEHGAENALPVLIENARPRAEVSVEGFSMTGATGDGFVSPAPMGRARELTIPSVAPAVAAPAAAPVLAAEPGPAAESRSVVKRLAFYFGLVYFAEVVAGGIVSQPFQYFLKVSGLTATQMAALGFWTGLPWMIKPLYGLMSDFLPLGGYRRKSYLLLTTGLAAAAFLGLASMGIQSIPLMVTALVIAGLGVAFSDVLVDAIMVENGKKLVSVDNGVKRDKIDFFQSVQWRWATIAGILVSLGGGALAQYLDPKSAIYYAALLAALPVLLVTWATHRMVRDEKVKVSRGELKATLTGLRDSVFKSKTFWGVAAFLAVWNFLPSAGTPMYLHMLDNLKISQGYMGALGALYGVGAVIGAVMFPSLARRFSRKALISVAVALSAVSALAALLLGDPKLVLDEPLRVVLRTPWASFTAVDLGAAGLNLFWGVVGMIPNLAMMSLMAAACNVRNAAFTFAVMTAVVNLTGRFSDFWGSWMFDRLLGGNLMHLLWIAAASALIPALLIRRLPELEPEDAKR